MRSIILASLLFFANASSAQSIFEKLNKAYVGGGFARVDSNFTEFSPGEKNNLVFNSLELLGGYKYSGYLSGELRAGFGLSDATLAGDMVAELDNYFSLYWRPETANEVAKLYGLLGYSSVSTTVGSSSSSDSGLSYGAGVGFVMFTDWNLNFEYRNLIDNDNDNFTALGVNIDYRF